MRELNVNEIEEVNGGNPAAVVIAVCGAISAAEMVFDFMAGVDEGLRGDA
ncbi:class IIb bacteriocin, lactobin A/cerein 7B family [Pseudoalteromonas sp. YIC-827]|uniref:Class IIb bacteriocin, lactobin A/cerein 7B family n=1 Tax=Pseudoalteromonas qingdaonensis TaxID=3131913 RepID=A0ABU9MWB0_9GAMM|nr:class IIb bacteriocin, lactobin A/cerein 7B family [Pseudoalteromonas sp. T1lg10]